LQLHEGVEAAAGQGPAPPGFEAKLGEAIATGPLFGGKRQGKALAAGQGEGDLLLGEAAIDVVAVAIVEVELALPGLGGRRG